MDSVRQASAILFLGLFLASSVITMGQVGIPASRAGLAPEGLDDVAEVLLVPLHPAELIPEPVRQDPQPPLQVAEADGVSTLPTFVGPTPDRSQTRRPTGGGASSKPDEVAAPRVQQPRRQAGGDTTTPRPLNPPDTTTTPQPRTPSEPVAPPPDTDPPDDRKAGGKRTSSGRAEHAPRDAGRPDHAVVAAGRNVKDDKPAAHHRVAPRKERRAARAFVAAAHPPRKARKA